MTEHSVDIAGGGPTGMMLAAELTLANVDVIVVERRPTQKLEGSRAGGLHSRTIEVFDMRGIAGRFLEAGQVMQVQGFAGIPLDISDFPTRHNYGLAIWQNEIERILADWVEEIGVRILRGREVRGFSQDDIGVTVELDRNATIRAGWLVGCDGGRSIVRKAAGIEFPGLDPSTSWMIAEAEMTETPPIGMRPEGGGIGPVNHVKGGNPYRIVLKEPPEKHDIEPTLADLRDGLTRIYGSDYGVHNPTWLSRFSDATRQAATYRNGRVLLAGDAAHIHAPTGGQGLNIGVQDAVNLGWKLAQVVKGSSPESLLDTYHAERYPVGARVLHNTKAQVALSQPDERHLALRDIVTELLGMDGPRRHIAAMMSGLDVHYDLGEGHPLLGRRMPDLDVEVDGDSVPVFSLLRDAKPVLLDFGTAGGIEISAGHDRIHVLNARYEGTWELPVLGTVAAPDAVLIRPDGYVAWVGEGSNAGLQEALTRWFGLP